MATESNFKSFDEFWPYYLGEHRLRVCRAWHYVGTVLSFGGLIALIALQQWQWIWVVLLLGYGPAWVGHFVFEKNKPATFKYPFWSLMGDYKMFYLALRGKIGEELSRHFGHQSKASS